MARFHLISLIPGVLFLVNGLSAQNAKPHFKNAEVKHFTLAEGVNLSSDFTNVLYDNLRSELAKTKQFDKVVGEGDAVADADALESVIIDGRITEFKKGRFGGPSEFHIHFTMIGRTSHGVLREIGSGTVWKIANEKESNMANRLAVLLAAFLDPSPLKLTN